MADACIEEGQVLTRPDIISLPELKKAMQKILAEKNTESSISSESVEY